MHRHKIRKNSLWPVNPTVVQSRIYLSLTGDLRVYKPNMSNKVTMNKASLSKSVNVAHSRNSWFSRESTILGKEEKLRVNKKQKEIHCLRCDDVSFCFRHTSFSRSVLPYEHLQLLMTASVYLDSHAEFTITLIYDLCYCQDSFKVFCLRKNLVFKPIKLIYLTFTAILT